MEDLKLTKKQEAFAQAIAKGANATEAYRQIYDILPTTKPDRLWVSASKLRSTPKVSQRIAQLQAEMGKKALRTREETLNRLIAISEEAYRSAQKEKSWTAKNAGLNTSLKAEAQISKMCGFDAAEKVDATIRITLSEELSEYGS